MTNTFPADRSKNLQVYVMEAAGIAGFVFMAGLLVIFLEHPSLPVMRSSLSQHAILRRMILGIGMGAYLTGITEVCKRSGAHLNPSVTLGFLSMGKIGKSHALLYILSQLVGAVCGASLLAWLTGSLFSHPLINYGITEPKPPYGMGSAFTGEFVISFIMMLGVLLTASSGKYKKYVGLVSGIMLASFIIFELPLSGMSMNPARSFGASLVADKWKHHWVYYFAPVLAMLTATEIFLRWKEKRSIFSGNKQPMNTEDGNDKDYRGIDEVPLPGKEKKA